MNKNRIKESGQKLIETDSFPFEFLSAIAEKESWRKDIYRPVYHIHKWWAKRLGSVFRGILLGCVLSEEEKLEDSFYQDNDFKNITVFDPFMGSGTTIGEAHKLGCTALGRDINPVAYESVRVALGSLDAQSLQNEFEILSSTIGKKIQELYKTTDENGNPCNVLYYFWVKQAPCPKCISPVDLFSSYTIARNAYPDRKPTVQILCPKCGKIFPSLNHSIQALCPCCNHNFNPHVGLVNGTKATCPSCNENFSVLDIIRKTSKPPSHRLYAKLVLTSSGEKRYLPPSLDDLKAYKECSRILKEEIKNGNIRLPDLRLKDGYNTRQAISYNYNEWRDFFNDRQLLALGWLQKSIAEINNVQTRGAFQILFSGLLEFNNIFASYKGEGTGAVRHMFSHHILKPERIPIEANVWGTSKSSGSFSTLFKSRLLRALKYRSAPFEIGSNGSQKVIYCNQPFSGNIKTDFKTKILNQREIIISCGSSDKTGLPSQCIDYVVTDPPFFDNVHYSELADFFYAWQKLYPSEFTFENILSTRNDKEVQDRNAEAFTSKLSAVFEECHRVMKDSGLLVFTYHHSRTEGWTSLANALYNSGFSIVNAHPVKSEMSVATPKNQAKEPIQIDIITICKKRELDTRLVLTSEAAYEKALELSFAKIDKLEKSGLNLSTNDRKVILYSQFLAMLGPLDNPLEASLAIAKVSKKLDSCAETILSEAK